MRQYQVPQFITIEDKVIGPFTIKQFVYLASAAALSALAYKFFESYLAFPIAAVAMGLGAALSFLTVSEIPFPKILKNMAFYVIRPRLFVWQKEAPKKTRMTEEDRKKEASVKNIPKLAESKLTDLAWSLDIKGKEKLRT